MANRMPTHETPQSGFWRGRFGREYSHRNAPTEDTICFRARLWARILPFEKEQDPNSICEIGANVGINLRALKRVSTATLYGVEPNDFARQCLIDDGVLPADRVMDGLTTGIPLPDGAVDLAFTSGVLIHVAPEDIEKSCEEIHRVSRRYIACLECFADKPEERLYRGHSERLFKRDFRDFYLSMFPDLRLINYGFVWKRATGIDNVTWQLFEKPVKG